MAKPNEHGVYVDFETVTVISAGRLVLEVKLAEDDGRWYYGIDYSYHNAGGGGHPSVYGVAYDNREDALEAGRRKLTERLEQAIAAGYEEPGTPGDKELRKGLTAVAGSRQMSLF